MTWYAKGFSGASELRGQLSVINSVTEGLDIIDRAIARLTKESILIDEDLLAFV